MSMNHIFAGVKWTCTVCDAESGTCDCWVKCECGWHRQKGAECNNVIWHAAREMAADVAEHVVEDMAESYKIFRREYMAERLKRAVIRKAQPAIIEAFEGVENAKRELGAENK